jgi:hypothetical protein
MAGLQGAYRRLRFGAPIVVVSGLPRSGTSMAMKMLEAGGIEVVTDGVRTADVDNPKGYFELEKVKNLHQDQDRAWLRDARGKAVKIISFLLKSLPADNNYKVVLMLRNLQEIVASQNKMLTNRGEEKGDDARAVELLQQDLRDARFFLRRPQFEVLDVQYKDALERPREQADRIAAFLGRPLDVAKMAEIVDLQLYRNRS